MAYRSCPHCSFGTIRTIDGSQQSCGMCGGTGSIWTPDPVSHSGGSSGSSSAPRQAAAPKPAPPRFQRVVFKDFAKYKGAKKFFLFPHGQGSATLKTSGTTYTGAFSWGLPHGEGKAVAGTYEIAGTFRRGKPHGDCILSVDGGTGFFCNFHNSYPKGEGVLTFPDGSRFEGKWRGHDHAKGNYFPAEGDPIPATIREGALRLKKSFFKKPVIARFSTYDVFSHKGCRYDP